MTAVKRAHWVQGEVDERNGLYAISTFLDCSKRYERVTHKRAQERRHAGSKPRTL